MTSTSQAFQLKIIGKNIIETSIIDSIGYTTKLQNTKQLIEAITLTSQKLSKIGYIENKILAKKKENDTNYTVTISLENKIKNMHIYIGIKKDLNSFNLFKTNQDSIILPYSQIEPFLKQTIQNLEQNGFAFAKVKLTNIKKKQQDIYADLTIDTGKQRTINAIEIKYTNQQQKNLLPKGAEKQINKKYKNSLFSQKNIEGLHDDYAKFGFINQIKYPEILFTKDTTKVFVYLEKRKANIFDGYLGFNNTENKKIQFNGYLDLTLINTLRNGEELSIYWKNDGNNQKIFNANLTAPYLFKSQIGIKAQLNIFKQDSIFQNTKTTIQLGYSIDYNKRFYFGYESTESSDIQNSNNQNLSDYKNSFYTTTIEFKENCTKNNLFPIKSLFNTTLGTGNRNTTTTPSLKQNFVNFNIMNDFYLNQKSIINVKIQNYFLKSKKYLTNELFRFGGINSIRGFAENSLQANLIISLMTEYRYLVSQNLYFNSILDYCYYEDPTITKQENKNEKLLGIGMGLGIQTSNGLLKFALTNGKTKNEELKFYNTNITISYNVKF
ncbi:MAG TPA: BamA/TamA family outer membrane protein [Flavobacterium sp.]|uniref:BamA/TamA family outer membrane protein n=1 Tax=Flavobacterium sp. TaxID=239 RepID=UPI002DB9C92E|nr:BamA/TamA family outer membrane protein [Flavobacterium sp.]HEU4789476.1 BamA/TamA family outer membrane protein [Flavobacterium sp.]